MFKSVSVNEIIKETNYRHLQRSQPKYMLKYLYLLDQKLQLDERSQNLLKICVLALHQYQSTGQVPTEKCNEESVKQDKQ